MEENVRECKSKRLIQGGFIVKFKTENLYLIQLQELNKKWQEQKQYENLSFTVDDLLIIQDKQQIDEFMNPYLFFININKWLETPKDKKTKVICKIYRLYHNR